MNADANPVGQPDEKGGPETSPRDAEMRAEDIRDAYRRSTPKQERLWRFLAEHPEARYRFSEAGEKIGAGRRSVPGLLGGYARRARRRYANQRPYRFYRNENRTEWWIWMDQRVARIIREEASKDVVPAEQPPDESALKEVDATLAEIRRRSEAIRAKERALAAEREERNLLVYRAARELRGSAGGRPTTTELARAMDVRHSYVARILKGKGHPVSSRK
jgi:hypothetical protein